MPPKKDGKSKGKEEQQATGAITEVEKTLLELQIAECNRKITRLRTAVDEYEVRNEELQNAYDKLDEDRADIIAYLKKILTMKTEENNELKEKVKGLEETRDIENNKFNETVAELEKNFSIMKDQLTSENKLLAGKLNTLEEFRAMRDDLMRKFEKQDQDFKEQEVKYKTIIYEAEKKFVISKDKLKREMEERLLQLAQDFQDATELRIAASTHRVIRENIAINHELDSILATQAKLAEQNEKFRVSERGARVAKELAEEEKNKTINKNLVQLKVINKLTNAFQEVKRDKDLFQKKAFDSETLQAKLQKCTADNESLIVQVRTLDQNLHAQISQQNRHISETSKMAKEGERLREILKEAAIAIQGALKLDEWAIIDPSRELMDRQALLSQLLEIVTQYREIQRVDSMGTEASYSGIYKEGDLGFIAKSTAKKSYRTAINFCAPKEKDIEHGLEKKSSALRPVSSTSIGSIKMIPSLTIVSPSSAADFVSKDSIESPILLMQSSESSEKPVEKEVYRAEMAMQLEASKQEIKKSIMKDLAYSQMAFRSQAKISKERAGRVTKSVVIVETLQGEEKIVKDAKTLEAQKVECELLQIAKVKGETNKGKDEEEKKVESEEPLEGTAE